MGDTELPKPGDLVGVRYRIETLLGQGGMGAVFAAVNQATGRAVAIKWLLPGAARSKESLARFLAEARATARIEHPNVIQILDVGQDGDSPFLVMERLRGESLAQRLERAGRMTPEEALRVLIPACKGLNEAHSEGIIHRDIKPDNIFLCQGKDGSPRPPKVLDFGISKLYDEENDGAAPMTRAGIAMGTPWYMSPEQLNAPPEADARFDVYAMGVVLYECLVGRPPYNAEGLFELVQQIAAGNPTPIRAYAPEVPPDLEAAAMRAMAANRDHRFPTMNDFIAELEAIQSRMKSGGPASHGPIPQTGGGYAPATGPTGNAWTPAGGGGYPTPPGYSTPGAGYGAPPSGPHFGTAPTMAAPTGGGGKGLMIGLVVGVLGLGVLALIGVGAAFLIFGSDDDGGTGVAVADPGGGGGVLGGGGGGASTNANPRDPQIDVTFSGACTPSWNARRMVTGGPDTLNVISSGLGGVTGSIMMSFPNEAPGRRIDLSTQHRMDTQSAVNVMVGQQLWTNMTMDVMAVRSGRIQDPISGSITLTGFDPELATADITFNQVTLQNMQTGTICTLNGRLQTFGTTYGM